MKKDYIILIPCFNEKPTIIKVVKELKKYKYKLLVVNDGSTDSTLDILVKNNIKHINIFPNQGKGNAIKEAVKYLQDKYKWFIICDADGQTPIKDIDKLLKLRRLYPKSRIIIGNRLNKHQNMPTIRLCANKLMSWIVSLLTGQKVLDSQCGLKIIHKNVFNSINTKCNRFDFETELLVKAGRKGYEIVNGDIDCIYFKNRISKINYFKDTYRFIKLTLTLIFKS